MGWGSVIKISLGVIQHGEQIADRENSGDSGGNISDYVSVNSERKNMVNSKGEKL